MLPPVAAGGDEEFCQHVASRLAGLPGVRAVALGGSRAAGTPRPDSDWDFAVYYRGSFDPGSLPRGWSASLAGQDDCAYY
jgi:predicted nucleotidyltransferase